MNHLGVVPTSAPSFPLSAQRFFTLQIPAESDSPAFMPKKKSSFSLLFLFFRNFQERVQLGPLFSISGGISFFASHCVLVTFERLFLLSSSVRRH